MLVTVRLPWILSSLPTFRTLLEGSMWLIAVMKLPQYTVIPILLPVPMLVIASVTSPTLYWAPLIRRQRGMC